MTWCNTVFSYGVVARFFHWVIAVAILCMLAIGLYMVGLPDGPQKLELIGLHKATGILILAAVILRFLWRQVNLVPALPGDLGALPRLFAHLSHFLLYFLMFYMPIVGWLMSSAAGFPVSVFGFYTLPSLIPVDHERAKLFVTLHNYGAYVLIGLVSLHVLAALYHHFIRRDTVLTRMLPW